MPIAARVVRDALLPALVAFLDMPAQRSRATQRQLLQHAALIGGQHTLVAIEKCRGVLAEDIAPFQGGTSHEPAFSSGFACPSRSRRSNGLLVVVRRAGDTRLYNDVVR